MNRETALKEILSIPNKNILCELATSFGKSRIAIELVKKYKPKKVLIAIPRNVLKSNWDSEFNKWYPNCNTEITYTTYVSLPKHCGNYEFCIFDECHHLSERCREALSEFKIDRSILLSATVSREMKQSLSQIFHQLYCYRVTTKQAIENNILPDPKIILIPLHLDNNNPTEKMIINPKGKDRNQIIPYAYIWNARSNKSTKFTVLCTQRQYYNEMSSLIQWYKKKAMYNEFIKAKWLQECKKRLNYLSNLKNNLLFNLLKQLKGKRTLTFCNSILQTEILSKNCINSQNKLSEHILSKFNEGVINHITAVDCLNEGMNLRDCQIGIFGVINASQLMVVQKIGRTLRHPNPYIIIPYYVGTREEELMNKMIENYNKDLIVTVDDIKEIVI